MSKNSIALIAYGASTAAGPTSVDLWKNIHLGTSQKMSVSTTPLLKNRQEVLPDYFVHLRQDLPFSLTYRQRILQLLNEAWDELLVQIQPQEFQSRLGIVFTSTKGFIEDVVWKKSTESDPITPLLHDFLKISQLKPVETFVVSEACASVAVAVSFAQSRIAAKAVDHVLIVSCDSIGEFVVRGFHSLQALTPHTHSTPFDKDRSGLQLGEAAAMLLVSDKIQSSVEIHAEISCEGVAATRPDHQGQSLFQALSKVLQNKTLPSLIIAHGTATQLNDSTEDFVFKKIYTQEKPSVTAIKWSVGHTLAVSCALDIIVARKCLSEKKWFRIPHTKNISEGFYCHYLVDEQEPLKVIKDSVLVSSLGFGGVHGGVLLQERESL